MPIVFGMYYSIHTLAILCLTILLSACNGGSTPPVATSPDGTDNSTNTPLADTIASQHFFYAWLADCVNDIAYVGKQRAHDDLLALANKHIGDAISDPAVSGPFGDHQLVWGPALSVNAEYESLDSYVAGNLIYCLKSTVNGEPHYSIGISGTDMISAFDWLTEDLDVSTQVAWPSGGKISQGSSIGFNTLQEFRANGVTLTDYLNGEITDSNTTVSVSGHSLGGALTQVMAAYLDSTLTASPTVQAWVYAGPTAGNAEFATTLVRNLEGNYFAYNNTLDVVPHAWQTDRLNEVCNLYDDLSFCGTPFQKNPAVNGIVAYLKSVSTAGDYTMPGTPVTFTPPVYTPSKGTCNLASTVLTGMWKTGIPVNLYRYPNEITQACNGGTKITEAQYNGLFYFLAEMGEQHTSGYYNHFFPPGSALNQQVSKYVAGEKSDFFSFLNADEGKDILVLFLGQIANGLQEAGITDCDCQ